MVESLSAAPIGLKSDAGGEFPDKETKGTPDTHLHNPPAGCQMWADFTAPYRASTVPFSLFTQSAYCTHPVKEMDMCIHTPNGLLATPSDRAQILFHGNSRLKEFGGNRHDVPAFDGFHLNLFDDFGQFW
jgi:hypothetical protein